MLFFAFQQKETFSKKRNSINNGGAYDKTAVKIYKKRGVNLVKYAELTKYGGGGIIETTSEKMKQNKKISKRVAKTLEKILRNKVKNIGNIYKPRRRGQWKS